MRDTPAKIRWEKENTIQVFVKINRNRNPELFELLQQSESKSGTVRDLLQWAVDNRKPNK